MSRNACLIAGLMLLGAENIATAAPTLPMPIGQDLPVEIVLNQPELAVDVSQTAGNVGMQFGLVGAIVGMAVQNEQAKKAEAAVVPMRNLLVEYAFNEQLEKALRAKLASEGISPNPTITVLKTPWDAVDAQNSQHVPLHALVLHPHYSVDSSFEQMNVRLVAEVVDREIRDDGKVKTKIQFTRVYEIHFPLVQEKGVDNSARWPAMGKERLAAILDEGIAQTTDIFVYDMSAKGRAEWPMDGAKVDITIKDHTLKGVPIRQTQDWAWVRSGWSRGQTVQGIEPVSEHDTAPVASSTAVGATSTAPSTPAPDANANTTPATVAAPANAASPAPAPQPAVSTAAGQTPATNPNGH